MRNPEPKDIPVHGQRYDMTVTAVGENKEGQTVVKALIDNGPLKGKRVSDTSGGLGVELHDRFSAIVYVRVDKGATKSYYRYALGESSDPLAPPEIKLKTAKQKFTRR